jgi:hypothetical protein
MRTLRGLADPNHGPRYVEGHAILYADVAANPALDFDYARQWAARLRVEDLLARALAEAEP